MREKILFIADYSSIPPMAPMYLAPVATKAGLDHDVILGTPPDYLEIRREFSAVDPDYVGATTFTGNHREITKLLVELKKRKSGLKTIVGGPHPTSHPAEMLEFADYVVPSEGFGPLDRILRKEVDPGIITTEGLYRIPIADTTKLFERHPDIRDSAIQSTLAETGCPFKCTYCNNSETLEGIASQIGNAEQVEKARTALSQWGPTRLFPRKGRGVDDVLTEMYNLRNTAPNLKLYFFQDDLWGNNIHWLREFTKKYDGKVPFHFMGRFEFYDAGRPKGIEHLELAYKAGCSGMTFAIESGNQVVRDEILDRGTMKEHSMFNTLSWANEAGQMIRTFNIIGLPYGATKAPTDMNIEEDLRTLEFNVKLKELTGKPDIAWASVLVPYPNTAIDIYCAEHGFYGGDHREIIRRSYRRPSVLKFAKKWIGPELTPETPDGFLSYEENVQYNEQLVKLMQIFPIMAHVPRGHEIARELIQGNHLNGKKMEKTIKSFIMDYVPGGNKLWKIYINQPVRTLEGINDQTRFFLYDYFLYNIKGPKIKRKGIPKNFKLVKSPVK